MKNFFTLTLCFLTLSITAQETITYPYNPDANGDTFVGVSDVLEGISTYDNFFFPEEIMVGDTTLSNWIQILNQTLANQQTVIDSFQASLDSQETQLDSTMIADMIAAAGGFGGGNGCDFSWPEGLHGEIITQQITKPSNYTVPNGKTLYITNYHSESQDLEIVLNGAGRPIVENFEFGQTFGLVNPIILRTNEIIQSSSDGLQNYFNGILIDSKSEVEPISLQITSSITYTVPIGKIFVITNAYNILSTELRINGTQTMRTHKYLRQQIFAKAGDVIDVTSGEYILNGYLADEDYFADCGGGGSSDGVSVFMAGLISGSDTVFVPESADVVYLEISGGNGHLALPLDNSYKKIEIIQEGTTGGNLDILGNSSGNYLSTASNDWQGIAIAIRNSEGFWRVIKN